MRSVTLFAVVALLGAALGLAQAWGEPPLALKKSPISLVQKPIFKPTEGKVCYFDIRRRMGDWKVHFSLDYGVMRAVDVTCTDSDILDALMGASSPSFLRSHVTAEVLGRADDRNPRYYYKATGMTLKRDFQSTREGKAVERNKKAYEGKLREAFDEKAEELVKTIHDVLEDRKALKSVVEKVGESLRWVG